MKFNLEQLKNAIGTMYNTAYGETRADSVDIQLTEGNVHNDQIVDVLTLVLESEIPADNYHNCRKIVRTVEVFSESENRKPTMKTVTTEELK